MGRAWTDDGNGPYGHDGRRYDVHGNADKLGLPMTDSEDEINA